MYGALSKSDTVAATPAKTVRLTGAGATFPYPLYSKWFYEYEVLNPSVQINYQSIGSGGGVRQILEVTVDFGASDAPLSDEELEKAPKEILHIPMTLGSVAVVYNLPGVGKGLRLTPDVLSGIYMGEIKRWNDNKIQSLNPKLRLPARDIVVTRRSDGSGTTYVFTDYLTEVSPEWAKTVGKGKAVKWPVGLGGKGNEGVAGLVKQMPGGIGYVELAYAEQNGLTYAQLKNRSGRFVYPGLKETSEAAGSAELPEDLRTSIADAPGESAYPISAFTYILVYREQKDPYRGRALAEFLMWALNDGQRYSDDLFYARLPKEVVKLAEQKVKLLGSKGQPLLK
ncbi:MAG: phosphate ABC transporter substrate-binding protein PstS [Firmicutes bacterium]|nr:phosphate ABC transporter substrate-binding protein PstS [Bacillota bacterium]